VTKQKILIGGLLVLAGILIFAPSINYQSLLAQGDHGRDLYAAEAVWRGELPYKDFWWVYGPLMPYYYGLFYKIFGVNITSALLGQIILKIISGLLIYFAIIRVIDFWAAGLCALWFWSFCPDFFFTYNHTGAITLLMVAMFGLFSYIEKPKISYLYIGLWAIFLLSFIKINIGLFSLVVFLLSVVIINSFKKIPFSNSFKPFYITAMVGIPLIVFAIYAYLLQGLSIAEIRQCLPYLAEDHPYNAPPIVALRNLLDITLANIASSVGSIFFALIILLSFAQTIFQLFNNRIDKQERQNIALVLLILILFYVANFHEFWASGIVLYRTLWSKPFSILLMFIILAFALRSLPRWIKFFLYGMLTFLIIQNAYQQRALIEMIKQNPWQNLNLERGGIFVGNQPQWIQTVRQATQYLKENLSQDETFLALPYDPLYYFLTGKPSPTRQLIFFEHINIPREQEMKIIQELKQNNVSYILLSNRSLIPHEGLGIFGETHCLLLSQYLKDNFQLIKTIGPWQPALGDGWAWDHSVQILRRINR